MNRTGAAVRSVGALLTAAACISLASCAAFDPTSLDDRYYVGPEKAATAEGAAAPAPAKTTADTGPIQITSEDAILLALENNRAFRVDRFNPPIRATFVDQERAAFDPVLNADVSAGRNKTERGSTTTVADTLSGSVGLTEFLPTGTTIDLTGTATKTRTETGGSTAPDARSATVRGGLSVTQSLLRGFGPSVNLAGLRQAKVDLRTSEYELRGAAEALVADVEETYWDYVLAVRNIAIVTDSADLAEKQLNETRERIKEGQLAPIELAGAEAELALRREELISARSAMSTTRLRLARLINPPGENLWAREITTGKEPAPEETAVDDVELHAALALRMRPDMNQARLGVQRGDLEVVKTRNGLLPKLDAFVNLGKSGYSDTFGGAVNDVDGPSYDVTVGLTMQYPLLNRDADARYRRSLFNREQAIASVDNLAQLVQVDVRTAHVNLVAAREQIAATAATTRFQREKVRAETEKFGVGRSTSLLVAQAQRDLLASLINEEQAAVGWRKALVELYRLDGSLLERRGIVAPGRVPVEPPDTGD